MSTEEPVTEDTNLQAEAEAKNNWPEAVDLVLELPGKKTINLPDVSTSETLNAIRQALADFQESAFLTSFKWELQYFEDETGQKLEKSQDLCNDFSELNGLIQVGVKKCYFKITEEPYDPKKVRMHVKRLKDICTRSYLVSAAPKTNKSASEAAVPESNDDEANKDGKDTEAEKQSSPLPKFDKLHDPVQISDFYNHSLNVSRKSAPHPAKASDAKKAEPLNAVIKNIFVSGWNPPPANRRVQGDLLYLEVTLASEGTVYITATARGFYVNRSNRTTFDPRPAASSHYNHNLFHTLLHGSAALRTAWTNLCQYSNTMTFQNTEGPLETFFGQLNLYEGDLATLPTNTWLLNADVKGRVNYDLFRAQEMMSDLHGVEELGAPREWNDEIQSIRSLPANELGEKVVKARLEYRIIADFTESCKRVAVAISEGLIAPLTYADPNQSNIYVYNGIFVSRAEDIKDAFHLCEGEEASRKSTSRDLSNQKLIKALEIEGLGTVLCTIVDFKGIRYVAQSIIPGIFNQGENCAQLSYGALEANKNLTVKNSTLKLYREIATKLSLAERSLPIQPIKEQKENDEDKPAASADHVDPLSKLLKQVDSQSSPIKVDEVDNVPVDEATQSIPHIGALESKMIQGSDGRLYAIEFMRLTPRDANYVLGEKGTKKINEEILSQGDTSLFSTYLLRQELISLFIHRKINFARQELLMEAANKEKELTGTTAEEKKETAAVEEEKKPSVADHPAIVEDEEEEENAIQIVKEDENKKGSAVTPAPVIDEALQHSLATEYAEKFRAINPKALQLEFNVNCFYDEAFPADIHPEILARDEALIREVSSFLFDHIFMMVTKQIREGEFFPRDSSAMVSYLHRMGINMRYLGHLATLAMEQEKEDSELMLVGKQRIHTMPFYWLEFLIVEMIARSVKHMLNAKLRNSVIVASSPAMTIASLLNHVMSMFSEASLRSLNNNNNEATTTTTTTATATESNNNNEEKKTSNKKKKKKGGASKGSSEEKDSSSLTVEEVLLDDNGAGVNGFSSREVTLQELSKTLLERFLYRLGLLEEILHPLVNPEPENKEKETELANQSAANNFLRNRLSPTMLLGRICQQCGIVLAARSFPFRTSNTPFTAEDVIGLIPKAKTSEPETYLPEFTDILNSSVDHLQQGNTVAAFDYAQQAVNIINQITGPNHLHAFQATDQLSAVLINSTSDIKSAISMASRAFLLAVQTFGLDSQETILHLTQLGVLYAECNLNDLALEYYQTAKYYLLLIAGEHHPELANIYMRLAAIYEKTGDVDSALKCLFRARIYTNDLYKSCMLTISIASVYYHHGYVHEAVTTQKNGYKIYKELVKADDERLMEVKKNLEIYLRASLTVPPDHRYPGSGNSAAVAVVTDGEAGGAAEGGEDGKQGGGKKHGGNNNHNKKSSQNGKKGNHNKGKK